MLQIISGKFYTSDNRFHNNCKGVLYSNAYYFSEIKAGHICLEPVFGDVGTTYVVSYDNQIEIPDPFPGFAPSRIGDHEIIRQIKLICSFSADAIYDEEKQIVSNICREKGIMSGNQYVPRAFLPSDLLNARTLTETEVDRLKCFFCDMIGLKRDVYLVVINCLAAYNAAIFLVDQDISLAYSMLVYCLESLSQRYDNYVPVWEDYDQNKKNSLERILCSIPGEAAIELKNLLIKDEHLKLTRRFINFATKYVSDSFFDYSPKINCPVQKDDIERALINAYNIRSRYVHMLQPVMNQLTLAGISKAGDVFEYEHDIFFTFSGLLRISKEIIFNFVNSEEKLDKETVDWRNQLPDTFTMEVAPQYWVWKPRTKYAMSQFSGFLSILVDTSQTSLPDMRKALQVWVDNFSNSSDEDKHYALALLALFNSISKPDAQYNEWENFLESKKILFKECCMANIILSILPVPWGKWIEDTQWELTDLIDCIHKYNKHKHKATSIRIPYTIETLIYMAIANSALDSKDFECFSVFSEKATFNSCGIPELQLDIKMSKDKKAPHNIDKWQEKLFTRLGQVKQEPKEADNESRPVLCGVDVPLAADQKE